MRRIFKLRAIAAVVLLPLLGRAAATVKSRATGAGSRELRLLMTQQQSALPSLCDENDLKRDAMSLLTAHFDVELGAVAPGDTEHVGFQHLVSSAYHSVQSEYVVNANERQCVCGADDGTA